jgi:hypothetical protein
MFSILSVVLKISNNFNRVTQQFTLDTIGSCLFGIETNSLQNENATLVKHLKQIFSISVASFMIIILSKSNETTFLFIYLFLFFWIVISPRLFRYLSRKGYSIFPRNTMIYLTQLVNQILSRRREHLERRNDFIQIMVDHEEEVKDEQESGTLKKSKIRWSQRLKIFFFSF